MSTGKKRETVGTIASDLMQKQPETRSPIEIQQAVHADYDKHISECIDRGLKEYDDDFFVVVLTKQEKVMQNVLRNYFVCRASCPTPTYDQTVYKYHRDTGAIEFLWVIPSQEASLHLKKNAVYVVPQECELLSFVLDFFDGTLDQRMLQLNNEA